MNTTVFSDPGRRAGRSLGAERGALREFILHAAGTVPSRWAAGGSGAGRGEAMPAGSPCAPGERCGSGAECIGGVCQCTGALANCSGQCVDTASDREHCGGCGNRCGSGEGCSGGVCCQKGRVSCDGVCCGPGQECVPASGGRPAACCPGNRVVVRCPARRTVTDPATGAVACDMSPAELAALDRACCPAEAVCSSGRCCLDPVSGNPLRCDAKGKCENDKPGSDTGDSSFRWTPPVKKG